MARNTFYSLFPHKMQLISKTALFTISWSMGQHKQIHLKLFSLLSQLISCTKHPITVLKWVKMT